MDCIMGRPASLRPRVGRRCMPVGDAFLGFSSVGASVLKYRISSAACALGACFVSTSSIAETSTGSAPDDALNEIVIVANRAPEPLSKIGNSVTVLDQAAIKESQATVL